jgi:hypothetical protein
MTDRNLRSIEGYLNSVVLWDRFNENCFDGGYKMGDIDGIAEKGGHFLLFEVKATPNIPTGQQIMHRRWLEVLGQSLLLLIGDPYDWYYAEFIRPGHPIIRRTNPELEEIYSWVREWFQWSSAHPAWRKGDGGG